MASHANDLADGGGRSRSSPRPIAASSAGGIASVHARILTMTSTLRTVRRSLPFLLAPFLLAAGAIAVDARNAGVDTPQRHLLYVAAPGVRDYLEFGGAGILVFDMDHGHAFVKRIDTPASQKPKPENIKGICACAATGKLYF